MYVLLPGQAVSNRTADVMRRQYFILLSLRLFHIFMSKSPIWNFFQTTFFYPHFIWCFSIFYILLVTIGYSRTFRDFVSSTSNCSFPFSFLPFQFHTISMTFVGKVLFSTKYLKLFSSNKTFIQYFLLLTSFTSKSRTYYTTFIHF